MNGRKTNGFTLIELMIVLAVISILAYIATSNYGQNLIKSKRTDGKTALLTTAATLEKCKAAYGVYNNASCSVDDGDDVDSPEQLYSVAVTTTATTFTLVANPTAGESQANDAKCTTLRLNHLGQQTATGSDPDSCW